MGSHGNDVVVPTYLTPEHFTCWRWGTGTTFYLLEMRNRFSRKSQCYKQWFGWQLVNMIERLQKPRCSRTWRKVRPQSHKSWGGSQVRNKLHGQRQRTVECKNTSLLTAPSLLTSSLKVLMWRRVIIQLVRSTSTLDHRLSGRLGLLVDKETLSLWLSIGGVFGVGRAVLIILWSIILWIFDKDFYLSTNCW
jgi:hypothetical protein